MGSPRILLVGAGSMGSRHARVIAESNVASLVRIIDPREAVGSEVAARFGADWAPEVDSLEGIDGVVIAAATEAHHTLAMAVLANGVPVLVEKPVADSIEDTREILSESRQRDVPLMCGLLERFNPAVLTAKRLLESPVHVSATRHSPYAPRIRTGVSWDLLVHDVDLAVGILGGEPTRVSGALGYFHPKSIPGAEDVAEAVLTFNGGGLAHISASRIGQRKVRSLTIYDVDKLVEVDLLRRDVTVYHHVSERAADDDGRGYRHQTIIEIPELVTSQEPLAAQLEHFVGLITGTTDAEAERQSILPSHQVISDLKSQYAVREGITAD